MSFEKQVSFKKGNLFFLTKGCMLKSLEQDATKRLMKKFFLFFILIFPISTLASVFPNDAITKVNAVSGTTNVVVVNTTTPKTILGIQIEQQNTASDTIIRCGTSNISHNYAKSIPQLLISYVCNNTINIQKTGNDTANVFITYVNYDLSIVPTFTNGDLMICLLLFIMIILALIAFLQKGIASVPVVRNYQGNNSPDGKEFYKL